MLISEAGPNVNNCFFEAFRLVLFFSFEMDQTKQVLMVHISPQHKFSQRVTFSDLLV